MYKLEQEIKDSLYPMITIDWDNVRDIVAPESAVNLIKLSVPHYIDEEYVYLFARENWYYPNRSTLGTRLGEWFASGVSLYKRELGDYHHYIVEVNWNLNC